MRTAPFGDHPAYLMPMSDEAVHLLVATLLERGEPVLGANGALPAVRIFCEEMAAASGKQARVGQHTRLFELGDLVEPARSPAGCGRPRSTSSTSSPPGTTRSWSTRTSRPAASRADSPHESPTHDEMRRRIEGGRVFVWVDEDDRPVHVTAATMPAYGVSRIGPVYTPREHRGRGHRQPGRLTRSRGCCATAASAPCLFTDQANPTSNKIYEAIGYRRVVDMANLRVE